MSVSRPSRTALDRAIAAVVVLWGWHRLLAAGLAGAASALALAPLHLVPVLFITLPVLVWLLDGTIDRDIIGRNSTLGAARTSFTIGWAFGFGYFLAGLYWVGSAFLVDAEKFGWAMPIAVIGLTAGLAIFTGLTCMFARILWIPGYPRIGALAASWTALEWVRGTILTGFPWNTLGQSLAGSDALIQTAAYVGDLGLSAILILICATPATLADPKHRRTVLRRALPSLAAVLVLASLWIAGNQRIASADAGTVPGVALRIVQPNIDQSAKWEPENRSRTVALYLEMSDSATSPESMGIQQVTHLIWPETALPLLLANEPQVMAQIAALLPTPSHLITGALRAEPPSGGSDARYFNSVLVIDGDGTITSAYDKRRLVPFGEFLPLQEWLEAIGLTQLTGIVGGFTSGETANSLPAGAVPRFAALICYEIVFADDLFVTGQRPGWIVNVTNDAWYGDTSGPWQHLAQARLRAVEQGLPVIRAANTGISAVIDGHGRVREMLRYGRRGVIDSPLPAPLEPTVYATYARLPVAVFLILTILGIMTVKLLRYSRGSGTEPGNGP